MSNLENFPPSPDIPNVEGIKDPFTFQKFCIRIGAIPSSYTEAMTIEEQILYFIDFLQNTVIPAVNNNADTINELIAQFTELYNYVHDYFDNLDVQVEINNKLNEMAEDGTLDTIINQQIFGNINSQISTINQKLQNDELMKNASIMIGDSYSIGHSSPNNVTGWQTLLAKMLGITEEDKNYYHNGYGSTGFVAIGGASINKPFLTQIQDLENTITNKNDIKNIIVCGGYNDASTGISYTQIVPAIRTFVQYCNQTYPNATVYIGMLGYNNANTNDGQNRRQALTQRVIPGYMDGCFSDNANTTYKVCYLSGVDNIMKDVSNFSDDNIHPNQKGYIKIAQGIFNALKQGYANYFMVSPTNQLNISGDVTESSSFIFNRTIQNNVAYFDYNLTIIYNNAVTPTSNLFEISDLTVKSGQLEMLGFQNNPRMPIDVKITYNDDTFEEYTTYITVNSSQKCVMYLRTTNKPIKSISGARRNYSLPTQFI